MREKPIDVVVAGHICVDITPSLDRLRGASLAEVLRPGKLLDVGAAAVSTGGTVSNTGLALRRLGLAVSLMGKCGDDAFGRVLLETVRREAPGAEGGMRVVPGERTSYSIVLAPPGVDRVFLHCPGCNDTFGAEDVDAAVVGSARLFHFGYPPLMKRMYCSGGGELARVMRLASESGVVTSMDLALPDPDSAAGRADWRAVLAAALPHTDLLLPSLEELLFMLRRERFEELASGGQVVAEAFTAEDLRALAAECIEMGARIVVIKCGHVGAYVRTADGEHGRASQTWHNRGTMDRVLAHPEQWSGIEHFEPSCRVESVASATGSGDSSIAGFLAALLRGLPPARCMEVLTVVGAQNLSALDAVSGVRSWQETMAELDAGPEKNPVPPRLADLCV